MIAIEWQTNLGYAQEMSHATRNPILLVFHHADCLGSQQMETLTYAEEAVSGFIREYLIPLKIDVEEESFYDKYHTIWTPAHLVLDYNGNEIQRTVGFLAPDDFLAYMHLGIAKVRGTNSEYDAANVELSRLLKAHPQSDAIPEALYFQGIFRYKENNDPNDLARTLATLSEQYPESSWTRRAVPFGTLQAAKDHLPQRESRKPPRRAYKQSRRPRLNSPVGF